MQGQRKRQTTDRLKNFTYKRAIRKTPRKDEKFLQFAFTKTQTFTCYRPSKNSPSLLCKPLLKINFRSYPFARSHRVHRSFSQKQRRPFYQSLSQRSPLEEWKGILRCSRYETKQTRHQPHTHRNSQMVSCAKATDNQHNSRSEGTKSAI